MGHEVSQDKKLEQTIPSVCPSASDFVCCKHCLDGTSSTFCTQAAMNCSDDSLFQNVTSNINCTCRQEHNVAYGEEGLYDVPAGIIALLSVFYGTISVLAVVGNSLVMWIVATSRRMQNVTNCFISNLALADIVIGLFAIPFQFQAALLQRWNLPHFMCAFCPFVQVLSVNVSVFTLTAIAVDRHRAILNPLSARPSKLRARLAIGGIWCVAGALAAPMAAALRVTYIEDPDQRCRVKPFCNNVHMSDVAMLSYRIVMVLVQYLTPLCIISCVYARMALRLWGSRAPGNAQDSRDANLMKNKKKVIKMLVIVVALFALCWLPLQTYNVLQYIYPEINQYRYINIIWFCCDWLAMSNSCYNPFIYGIYNEKFKREFQQRCPFKSRTWSAHSHTIDSDFDKSQTSQTRASVRLSYYSNHSNSYDWRRSYSTRAQQHVTLLPQNNTFYRGVSIRGPIRRHNTSNSCGLTTELYVSPEKHQKNGNSSDMDELCL